ncbi:MAG: hypothetical protein ACE5EX_01835 [Phycisphaerae bacterium]
MAGASYVVTNLLNNASVVVAWNDTVPADIADSTYPVTNLYNELPSKPGKSTSGSSTEQNIDIDFAANITQDTIALINHNLVAGTSVLWQSDDNNDGNYSAVTTVATFTIRARDMFQSFTQVADKRYMRLNIGASGGDTTLVSIGEIVVGAKTQLTRPWVRRFEIPERWTNNVLRTPGGVVWSYNLTNQTRSFRVSWSGLSASNLDELRTLAVATKGNHIPFTLIPYPDETGNPAAEVYYVRGSDLEIRGDYPVFDASMTFTELVRELQA